MRRSYDPTVATNATILYWKLEDVPMGDGDAPRPEDIGPAWIYTPDGAEETVLDGEWISRADAQRLAVESGYELQLDDGFDP
jgi:hypothetical protein